MIQFRRLAVTAALLSAPAAAVLALLVVLGQLAILPALLAGGVILLAMTVLIRPHLADVGVLEQFVRDMERDDNGPPPRLKTALADDLFLALSRLRRSWRIRTERLDHLLGFHESLLDSLPAPLLLLNGHRRIVFANRKARSLLGDRLEGRDLATALRIPALSDAADKVLASGTGCEVEFAATGYDREFRALIEPLNREGEGGARLTLALHDITAWRRMERMRTDFVTNASHELRTPLSAILGFIETLQGPARDDEAARERFLSIMFDQASRMSRLLSDLLNLSRIESAEYTPLSERCAVAPIIRRVATGLEVTAQKRSMSIRLELDDSLPDILGKEDELAQILQNLLDNALKYSREDSVVTVRARKTPPPAALAARCQEALAISVEDQGEGIAPEHLPRLTERFFRIDTARSRRMGGTGLGLAIVKHLVNRHRGLLVIDSEPGKGSCFTVFLPPANP